MTHEDKEYRQGRSKRQQESNEMIAMWGFTLTIIFLIGMMLYSIF